MLVMEKEASKEVTQKSLNVGSINPFLNEMCLAFVDMQSFFV